jgi:hypothetical protein
MSEPKTSEPKFQGISESKIPKAKALKKSDPETKKSKILKNS